MKDQKVAGAKRGGAHQIGRQRNAVAVAAGDLQHRLMAVPDEQCGRGEARHGGAGGGGVGNIDRVDQAFERLGAFDHIVGAGGNRWRHFGRDDELAGVQL